MLQLNLNETSIISIFTSLNLVKFYNDNIENEDFTVVLISIPFNPIEYRGRGDFSHTTIVLAATLKSLKLWPPKLCDFLFLPFLHNLRKF